MLQFLTAGVSVDLDCDDEAVAALVAAVGAGMLRGAGDDHSGEAPQVRLAWPTDGAPSPSALAAQALSAVDRAALAGTNALVVHAAALSGETGCVVLPGASGTGKSTLAAAAMQVGLRLVSDEAACLTEPLGTLLPHPRPLGLSAHSRRLLGLTAVDEQADEVGVPGAPGAPPEDEEAVAPALLGNTVPGSQPVPCVLLALPVREVGARATLREVPRTDGLAALLSNLLNANGTGWEPGRAFAYLHRLVEGLPVLRLTYDSPYAAAELLARELTSRGHRP